MIATTLVSLVILFFNYLQKRSYILLAADLLLFILSTGMIVLFFKKFLIRTGTSLPS